MPTLYSAEDLLRSAAQIIEERGKERDLPHGERSMRRAVEAFNALTGRALSETEGWLFMAVLKIARSRAGNGCLDDYLDGAAYIALAGESVWRGKAD